MISIRTTLLGLALTATPALAATTIHVPADYPTISQAIGFSQHGDTILVSPGIYPEQVDFQGKDIVIRSTNGPAVTTLDGQGQYTVVMFVSGETAAARLEGFTVKNGLGLQEREAGGIWCKNSDPTIASCVVTENTGWSGTPGYGGAGGIGSDRGSPTIVGCTVEANRGGDGLTAAGGIGVERSGYSDHGSGTVIRDCTIRRNVGGNTTTASNAGAGGIFIGFAIATIEGCNISRNVGGDTPPSGGCNPGPGGIWSYSSAVQVRDCRILSNRGGSFRSPHGCDGGGVGGIMFWGRISATSPTLPQSMVNTIVAWNRGGDGDDQGGPGGVHLFSSVWMDITNCAVVGNTGGLPESVGGLYTFWLDSALPATVTNTIFWLNEGQGAPDDIGIHGDQPVRSHLLRNVDPEFENLAGDDFHLSCFSPAIDAGTDTAPVLPLTDLDGEPRVSGAQVDIGPYEFQDPAVFPTYCPSTPNSSGQAAIIRGVGCLSIAENDMRVLLAGLPNTPGLLFYGPTQIQVSFGDGIRCVGGAIRRLPPMPGMGMMISIELDLPALQVTPGVRSNFQYWFRDPMAGGAGFNTSDALEVNFVP